MKDIKQTLALLLNELEDDKPKTLFTDYAEHWVEKK